MSNEQVVLDWPQPRLARIRIVRPPLNALSQSLLVELAVIAEGLLKADDLGAVVVAGSDRAFAAGADIAEFSDAQAAASVSATFRRAFDAVASIHRPVIAAIRGFALGGGLELALACDLRVAGDTARLGQPEVLLGIIPGAGGTQRLPRLVGPARAKEMVWSGRTVKAQEALDFGLVDRVVADGEVEETALAWASSLAAGASVAIGLAKRAIDSGLDGSLPAGLDREAEAFTEAFSTKDAAVGIKSFLTDGPGKAKFTGT
jgi:enoyl-CoA hydratase